MALELIERLSLADLGVLLLMPVDKYIVGEMVEPNDFVLLIEDIEVKAADELNETVPASLELTDTLSKVGGDVLDEPLLL